MRMPFFRRKYSNEQEYYLALIKNTRTIKGLESIRKLLIEKERIYIIPDKVYYEKSFKYIVFDDSFKQLHTTGLSYENEKALRDVLKRAIDFVK